MGDDCAAGILSVSGVRLALRMLVAEPKNPLSEILDATLSLAHQTTQMEGGEPIPSRIARLFAEDPRWREILGCEHLVRPAIGADPRGVADLPEARWWEVLALLGRFFPGVTPAAFCAGYGDAPPEAMAAIFDTPTQELDALLLRQRAFLLGGWHQNLEMARVIDGAAKGVAGSL